MRIAIIAVGKVKQAGLRGELDEYLARIAKFAPCGEVELRDGSDAELAVRFERAIPPRTIVVALEVEGVAYDSPGLAAFLGRSEVDGAGTLAFLLGGAFGLPKAISAKANLKLSLSSLTFSHRLARLILAEQLYRAFTILRNVPYAH